MPCAVPCQGDEVCFTGLTKHGECVVPTCAVPGPGGLAVFALDQVVIAPTEQGCDLNEDAKPDNAMGVLSGFLGDTSGDTANWLATASPRPVLYAAQWPGEVTQTTLIQAGLSGGPKPQFAANDFDLLQQGASALRDYGSARSVPKSSRARRG